LAACLGVTPEQLTGQDPISVRLFDKGAVPIGRWETLTHTPHIGEISPGRALICPIPHSDMSFALPVIGEAMVGEDGYREGDLIFIDPFVKAAHGRDVVAVSPKAGLLRRYIETPEGQFLKALNPSWPNPILPLTSDIIVMGTVIFSGRIR
jgi:SOS-response transcriptional repressor LexA